MKVKIVSLDLGDPARPIWSSPAVDDGKTVAFYLPCGELVEIDARAWDESRISRIEYRVLGWPLCYRGPRVRVQILGGRNTDGTRADIASGGIRDVRPEGSIRT